MAAPHYAYQDQDSTLTLAEGLANYYTANKGVVTSPQDLPPESRALFRSHDMCHVIFGLGTTLGDETLADTRTLFSCDVGVQQYLAYLSRDAQAKALFQQMGIVKGVFAVIAALPRILRAGVEALRMKKRWPWTPPESFQGRTLADLRSEFAIRVI